MNGFAVASPHGNVAIALLANTVATEAALVARILTVGPGIWRPLQPRCDHADASQGGVAWRFVPGVPLVAFFGDKPLRKITPADVLLRLTVSAAFRAARETECGSPAVPAHSTA